MSAKYNYIFPTFPDLIDEYATFNIYRFIFSLYYRHTGELPDLCSGDNQ